MFRVLLEVIKRVIIDYYVLGDISEYIREVINEYKW